MIPQTIEDTSNQLLFGQQKFATVSQTLRKSRRDDTLLTVGATYGGSTTYTITTLFSPHSIKQNNLSSRKEVQSNPNLITLLNFPCIIARKNKVMRLVFMVNLLLLRLFSCFNKVEIRFYNTCVIKK